MKSIIRYLQVLHLIVGIGAAFGGLIGMLNPDGSVIGMSTDVLRNGPFNNFMLPSVFLFTVLGIGNIIAAYTTKLNKPYQAYISGILGSILCMWIIIQCYIMWAIAMLHVIFFVIGIIQLGFSVFLAFKIKLYPTQYIMKILSKMSD